MKRPSTNSRLSPSKSAEVSVEVWKRKSKTERLSLCSQKLMALIQCFRVNWCIFKIKTAALGLLAYFVDQLAVLLWKRWENKLDSSQSYLGSNTDCVTT